MELLSHQQHYLLAFGDAHVKALEECLVNGVHEIAQMQPVPMEHASWGDRDGEMWKFLTFGELIAVYHEWQKIELRPIFPYVPSGEVVDARILDKCAFLALLLLQPLLQLVLWQFGTTLEELVVVYVVRFIHRCLYLPLKLSETFCEIA